MTTRRHDLKVTFALSAEESDLIDIGIAVLGQELTGMQEKKKEKSSTSSKGVFQLYNATRQQISNILLLALTARLF